MRLSELNPEFVNSYGGVRGVGIAFDCPCGDRDEEHRCYVPFKNALDGTTDFKQTSEPHTWQRAGETFEELTLTPSIHRVKERGGCGWHGFVTNGDVTTC